MERFGGQRYDTVDRDPPWAATTKPLVKLLEREFGSLHLRHDHHDQQFHALSQSDGDILYLLRSMPEILRAKRRNFSSATRLIIVEVLSTEPYEHLCPCCGSNAVIDPDYRRSKAVEFDHWYDQALNLPIDGWLICRPCHVEISNDHVAAQARAPAFHRFQAAVIAWKQARQLIRPLKK
jgi:hypothetical protein